MGAVTDRAPTVVAFPFVGELVGGSHISACGLIRALDRSRFTPLVLLQHPDGAVGRLFRLEIDATIRATAAAFAEPNLRSLDAIHLATAQVLANEAGATLTAFVTYDQRLLVGRADDGRCDLRPATYLD